MVKRPSDSSPSAGGVHSPAKQNQGSPFTVKDQPWFCFAGLWTPDADGRFTILTTAPGPDVAPYHDRQVVVLPREDWAAWLDLTRPEAELLKPSPEGTLQVEQVVREA